MSGTAGGPALHPPGESSGNYALTHSRIEAVTLAASPIEYRTAYRIAFAEPGEVTGDGGKSRRRTGSTS